MSAASLTVSLACIRGCASKGLHLPSCGAGDCACACHTNPAFPPPCDIPGGCRHDVAPDCRGCKPRAAMPGAVVCLVCWERTTEALAGIGELYDDLLTPARRPARDGVKTGKPAPSLPLAPEASMARDLIREILTEWVGVLAGPAEPTKARRDAWNAARNAWETGRGPEPEPLPDGPYGRGITRPTSDDPHVTLPVVSRHAEWLLTQADHADQFVHDVLTLTRHSQRTVKPGAPDGVMIGFCPTVTDEGPCGKAVRAVAGSPVIVCRGCGTKGDAATWRRLLNVAAPPATDTGEPADDGGPVAPAATIAAWLSLVHGREVTATVVRMWAAYPVKRAGGVTLPRQGRDLQGRTLHPVRVAEQIAAALYPPREETA